MKKVAAQSLFVLIVCLVMLIVVRVGSAVQCDDVADQTGLRTKYSMISGCYIMSDNRWHPIGLIW